MWKLASVLVGITVLLVALGLVMLASTSGVQAQHLYGNPLHFFYRQLMWVGIGLVAGLICSRVHYRVWSTLALPLALVCVVLLIACLAPGIGRTINGSARWIRLGPINFQPSELAKFGMVALLAWWMARYQRKADRFMAGALIPLALLGLMLVLILIEPDYGTTMLIAAVGVCILFVAGSRWDYLVIASVLGMVVLTLLIMQNAERMGRITTYRDPLRYFRTDGYQLANALFAFVDGGPWGRGFGRGMQKLAYLPEAHTDFIYAIIGEELGLPGSLAVVLLFAGFFLCGLRIALRAPDKFGQLLGFGLTVMLTMQAAINIGVVTGCLPTKGLALPFISFGGSSMLVSMIFVGILVNIALNASAHPDRDTPYVRDRMRFA